MNQPALSKTKIVFFLFLTCVLACLFLLVSATVFLKVQDRLYHKPHDPGDGKEYTWGHLVTRNQYSFREREIDLIKTRKRVMVLGDSFTFGVGLDENARFSNRLEKILQGRVTDNQWEVLNFGVPSFSTQNEREVFLKYKDVVKPDRVIVAFCFNDPAPLGEFYSDEQGRFTEKYGRFFLKSADVLNYVGMARIVGLVKTSIYKSAQLLGFFPNWRVALQRSYEPDSKNWKDFVQALADIKAESDRMKLPPPIFASLNSTIAINKPTDYGNPDKDLQMLLRWYHQAERAAGDVGYVTVNFETEIARDLKNKVLSVNRWDWHSSAELNAVYAEKLATLFN